MLSCYRVARILVVLVCRHVGHYFAMISLTDSSKIRLPSGFGRFGLKLVKFTYQKHPVLVRHCVGEAQTIGYVVQHSRPTPPAHTRSSGFYNSVPFTGFLHVLRFVETPYFTALYVQTYTILCSCSFHPNPLFFRALRTIFGGPFP